MASHKDSALVERLEVVELGRRRRWTAAAKRRIVEESLAGHRQASATARRYGLSPSLLFAWRQAYRAGELGGIDGSGFVPVVVTPDRAPMGAGAGRMEIVLGDGCRVVVGADVDGAALGRVLQALERR